jgi:hypothetical protein
VDFYIHWKIATGKFAQYLLEAEIESIACLLLRYTLFDIDL